MLKILNLFLIFLKIGFIGFGGGYAMISLIMDELYRLDISVLQFADLNALDMIVPGPIMINAATYVGFLNSGFWGAVAATVAVTIPSFIYVSVLMHFIDRYRRSNLLNDILSGVKPAAVGLIAAAAMTIAAAVMDLDFRSLFSGAFSFVSILPAVIFVTVAFANIKVKINPILLTLLAGVAGAFLLR